MKGAPFDGRQAEQTENKFTSSHSIERPTSNCTVRHYLLPVSDKAIIKQQKNYSKLHNAKEQVQYWLPRNECDVLGSTFTSQIFFTLHNFVCSLCPCSVRNAKPVARIRPLFLVVGRPSEVQEMQPWISKRGLRQVSTLSPHPR